MPRYLTICLLMLSTGCYMERRDISNVPGYNEIFGYKMTLPEACSAWYWPYDGVKGGIFAEIAEKIEFFNDLPSKELTPTLIGNYSKYAGTCTDILPVGTTLEVVGIEYGRLPEDNYWYYIMLATLPDNEKKIFYYVAWPSFFQYSLFQYSPDFDFAQNWAWSKKAGDITYSLPYSISTLQVFDPEKDLASPLQHGGEK